MFTTPSTEIVQVLDNLDHRYVLNFLWKTLKDRLTGFIGETAFSNKYGCCMEPQGFMSIMDIHNYSGTGTSYDGHPLLTTSKECAYASLTGLLMHCLYHASGIHPNMLSVNHPLFYSIFVYDIPELTSPAIRWEQNISLAETRYAGLLSGFPFLPHRDHYLDRLNCVDDFFFTDPLRGSMLLKLLRYIESMQCLFLFENESWTDLDITCGLFSMKFTMETDDEAGVCTQKIRISCSNPQQKFRFLLIGTKSGVLDHRGVCYESEIGEGTIEIEQQCLRQQYDHYYYWHFHGCIIILEDLPEYYAALFED